MSRTDLADAVNAWLHRSDVLDADVDANYVGKLERGVHRWPGEVRRRAFRGVLHAATDLDLGFHVIREAVVGETPVVVVRPATHLPPRAPVHYMPFLPAALDRPALDWMCDERPLAPPHPAGRRRLDPAEAESVARRLLDLRDSDHSQGAGLVAAQVAAFLHDDVEPLLSTGLDDPQLAAAVYRIAIGAHELAGYQAVDLGADGLAQRHYLHALTLTRTVGDRALGAYLLGVSLGHLALHCGFPDRSLRMAQTAIKGLADQGTPVLNAALHAVLARAHARLGDSASCAAALHIAEADLSRSDSAAEPSWIGYLTEPYLADEIAHCMYDLGSHGTARREVRYAMAGVGATRVRRLAIDTALLASSLAADRQIEEACFQGREATDLAARIGSARAVQRVAQVSADLLPFSGSRAVAELTDYVHATLPAALEAPQPAMILR
jgi:hypothetical protein